MAPERDYFGGTYGVMRWDDPSITVTGRSGPTTGSFSVADPRLEGGKEYGQYGVRRWEETAGAITGQSAAGGGRFSVADPRLDRGARFNNVYRVISWMDVAQVVTGGAGPTAGGLSVTDPRCRTWIDGKENFRSERHYGILRWDQTSIGVTANCFQDRGPWSVADPRPETARFTNNNRVERWDEPAHTVTGTGAPNEGALSVADPRLAEQDAMAERLPAPDEKGVFVIRALDGTWHRPLTTLELAALQGLVEPGEALELAGTSTRGWRERIGNAVPSPAAEAIASVMGRTLLLAWTGVEFELNAMPVWVSPRRTPPELRFGLEG